MHTHAWWATWLPPVPPVFTEMRFSSRWETERGRETDSDGWWLPNLVLAPAAKRHRCAQECAKLIKMHRSDLIKVAGSFPSSSGNHHYSSFPTGGSICFNWRGVDCASNSVSLQGLIVSQVCWNEQECMRMAKSKIRWGEVGLWERVRDEQE